MMVRLVTSVVTVVLVASPVFGQGPEPTPIAAPRVTTAAQEAPATSIKPDLPSFGSLFRELGQDIRRMPSQEAVWILGIGGGLSFAARSHDVDITGRASKSLPLDTFFEAGDLAGGGFAQIGAAITTLALGRVAESPRTSMVGADLIRAQLLNGVLTQGIKRAAGRTRPDGSRFSFPSGHTSSSFATAAVLQRHFGWKAGIPAYGLAAYVGGSRLQENRHYLSDVLFGAAVGIVSGRTVTVGRGRSMFAVAPFAKRGGAGVGFVWIGQP